MKLYHTTTHTSVDMSYTVRHATKSDLQHIMPIIDAARQFMVETGNPHQWADGYPAISDIDTDILNRHGYVVVDGQTIVAYFAFIPSPDPTYAIIYDGHWLCDSLPYHVIHRIASLPTHHGIFDTIISYCSAIDSNLRIDTHRDNHVMQHCILSHKFTYRGIVHIRGGAERLAYQRLDIS